jgi:uncharacterized protein DUF6580
MMMDNRPQARTLAFGLTLLSALGRLVPHAPNVTPLGGSCLFAGSRVPGVWAYLLPLAVMIATDPFVGGYWKLSPVVYACFLINVWIGRRIARKVTAARVGLAAFICSLQFFLLTNFAIWINAVASGSRIYSPDLGGLLRCYEMALPFWGRTLAGDLFFSAALFGIYELLSRRLKPAGQVAAA